MQRESKIEFVSKNKRKEIEQEKEKNDQVKESKVSKDQSKFDIKSFFSVSQQEIKPQVKPEIDQNLLLNSNELAEIKSKYLVKKSFVKPKRNPKKFVFDWNENEDTSKNIETIAIATKKLKSQSRAFDDRHWSAKKLEEMTERDWRIFKEDYSISVKGASIPPIRHWNESGLSVEILDIIKKIGYKEPTPIQRQAIPLAISNRDLIAIAETGSGKTASFVIPMLCFIKHLPKLDVFNSHLGPYALVLAPTRELALQIETECKKFTSQLGFICVSIVGGHKESDQTMNLLQGMKLCFSIIQKFLSNP